MGRNRQLNRNHCKHLVTRQGGQYKVWDGQDHRTQDRSPEDSTNDRLARLMRLRRVQRMQVRGGSMGPLGYPTEPRTAAKESQIFPSQNETRPSKEPGSDRLVAQAIPPLYITASRNTNAMAQIRRPNRWMRTVQPPRQNTVPKRTHYHEYRIQLRD